MITIVLFDENGQYEVSLPTNDSSEIELEGQQMKEYEAELREYERTQQNHLNRVIDENSSPYIIAEISGNHNGSLERAKELITLAKENGASCVKLQTYTPETMTISIQSKK